jgi:hypothetical protein
LKTGVLLEVLRKSCSCDEMHFRTLPVSLSLP